MTIEAARGLLEAPPLAIYVHLPWCVSKCPYCDFNSHALRGALPEEAYLAALRADIEGTSRLISDRRAGHRQARSLFFGGGTPSLFSPRAIARVVDELDRRDLLASDAEVTIEANPGAVERGAFSGYAAAGVNRVSLGVQSFDPEMLRRLGRIHTPADARAAIDDLHAADMGDFNVDLMYGLPGQSPDGALADVEAALGTGAPHLSHYQLTIEPNTLFHARPPALPDEDAVWEMQVACQAMIAAAGLSQYEVSAYARPGSECRHNLNYWTYGDYLGFGAGAHGKLTFPRIETVERSARPRHPGAYTRKAAELSAAHRVSPEERVFEFMLNALRLLDGFAVDCFERRTGVPRDRIRESLAVAADRGLLEEDDRPGWRPTDLGRRYLNDLQAIFLPSAR